MNDKLLETIKILKIQAIAFQIANEFGAVPNIKELDDVCETFGDEHRELYIKALESYEGYSDSDLSSDVLRTLSYIEI